MKKIFFLAAMLGCFFTAWGWRIEYGNNIIISKPVYEDLYIAGGTVTINAPVYGDLIIAGGTIVINDTVTSDILLAGGNVSFNGFTGDDIRCAGGKIYISKNVSGDVVVTGGTVVIEKGAAVGGLLMSGGEITINGNVNGAVKAAAGNFTINGTIAKELDCRGEKISINGSIGGTTVVAARDIIIGSNAAFNNSVRYWNRQGTLDFKQSLKNVKASFDPSLRISNSKWYYLGAATLLGLFWYLSMVLLMILIVQYLFSNTMKRAAVTVFENTLKSLGLGALFFIAIPVAATIAFITLAGVPVGILLLVGYLLLLLLATVITSVVAANWFNNRNNYKWNNWRIAFTAFGIFILLKMLSIVPVAGWLCLLVAVCMAFGSILLNINLKNRRRLIVLKEPE